MRPRSARSGWRATIIVGAIVLAGGSFADEPAPVPSPGIGFLWYPRSEQAAAMLSSAWDFVDVILGGDKLRVFEQVQPPVRVVCLSLALQRHEARPFPGVKETIEALRAASIDPARVIIGYNPERAPGTTAEEMDNLLQSVQTARDMARDFGSPLLVGPGLREMQQREELYPDLAALSDIWLIQSQRLQMDPATREPRTPEEYRAGIERIVQRLHEGNPEIKVFVQLIAGGSGGADRFTAEEFVAYVREVEDLVHAVRIYGGSPELLAGIIGLLRPQE